MPKSYSNLTTSNLLSRTIKHITWACNKMDEHWFIAEAEFNPEKTEFPIDGYFNPDRNLQRCKIVIRFEHVNNMKGKKKLRVWDSSIKLTAIHEICHAIIYKRMAVKERNNSTDLYSHYYETERLEEIAAWTMTLNWVKKLRMHKSLTHLKNLNKFYFPEGFKLPNEFLIRTNKN